MSALAPGLEAARECLISTATPYGSSRWAEYRRCQRAHHLRYHLRVHPAAMTPELEVDPEGPDSTDHFDVGIICHAILAYMQLGVMASEPSPRRWEDVLDAAPESLARDEATRLMTAYWAHYGTENAGWPEGVRIIAVEQFFESQFGPLPYTARADSILEFPSGEIVVVDHKTRAQAFGRDRDRFARGQATRGQFLGLSWLVRRALLDSKQAESDMCREDKRYTDASIDTPSIWLNAIIKTKIVKFDRLMLPITRDAVDQWSTWQRLYSELGLDSSLPNPDACAPAMGQRCQYFTWCHGTDDERARHYTQGTPE